MTFNKADGPKKFTYNVCGSGCDNRILGAKSANFLIGILSLELTSPKWFSATKWDVGNWIFSKSFFF